MSGEVYGRTLRHEFDDDARRGRASFQVDFVFTVDGEAVDFEAMIIEDETELLDGPAFEPFQSWERGPFERLVGYAVIDDLEDRCRQDYRDDNRDPHSLRCYLD